MMDVSRWRGSRRQQQEGSDIIDEYLVMSSLQNLMEEGRKLPLLLSLKCAG
jgi:hypothetical protein